VAALVLLAASFALLTVLARYLNTGFTIFQQVYLRSAAAFAIATAAFWRKIRWRAVASGTDRREWGVILLRTILLYAIGTTLYSKAATMTSVGEVSFIAALPLVSVVGLLTRRAMVTRLRALYVLGSAVGATVLAVFSGSGPGLLSWNDGDLVALVAMLAIAVSYLGRSWHSGHLNNHEITALTVGIAAVSVVCLSVAAGQGLPHLADSGLLWGAVVVAGALNVLNVFLVNFAFEHVDPVRAGNLLTLECVWGLAFGLMFFGQVPGVGEIIGGGVIVCCAIGLNKASAAKA
jgi:drug/metabolite transporter (DMT)-like permease